MNGRHLRIPEKIIFGPVTHTGEDVWSKDFKSSLSSEKPIIDFAFAIDPYSLNAISMADVFARNEDSVKSGDLTAITVDVKYLEKKFLKSPKEIYEYYGVEFSHSQPKYVMNEIGLYETKIEKTEFYRGGIDKIYLDSDGHIEISCETLLQQVAPFSDISPCHATMLSRPLSAEITIDFQKRSLKNWRSIQSRVDDIVKSFLETGK
jgi:hypothetical protein